MNAPADTRPAVERVARESYARLLAFLGARSRNLAAAEDALADAFEAALATWPRDGIPEKPEAWLLTASRRRLVDERRHQQVVAAARTELLVLADMAEDMADAGAVFPDERLKLMFVCAHPAIDPVARTPLMLQTILGLDAARIASAFLVKPSAMGQRLSRAKTKIRDAGIAFEVPGPKELPARLEAVLEAVYAAYGSGWHDVTGADARRRGLAAEALELGRLLQRLMGADAEILGLLALMLYCESRRDARRDAAGGYVPLSEQDVRLWSEAMITEADGLLASAEQLRHLGRFQLEAAIQAVHAQRARSGKTDWETLALLYEGLAQSAPTAGALVGRAAACAEAYGAEAGWAQLQELPRQEIASYQPYWALAAHLLKRMGRAAEAADAYRRATGLCEDPAVRDFLLRQQQAR